eukprot:1115874-Rhodomonas_salina.2
MLYLLGHMRFLCCNDRNECPPPESPFPELPAAFPELALVSPPPGSRIPGVSTGQRIASA